MLIKSEQKFLLMSPRKLMPVVGVIRKMSPGEALEKLPFVGRKAAQPLMKVIKSALANARQKGLGEDSLIFKEIRISEGPRLKRGRPISRGQWHPIKKRMSHIRVVLEGKELKAEKKEVKKENSKVKEKKAK